MNSRAGRLGDRVQVDRPQAGSRHGPEGSSRSAPHLGDRRASRPEDTLQGGEVEHAVSAVLIVGMHRSGISCLTGCLEETGLALGTSAGRTLITSKGIWRTKW